MLLSVSVCFSRLLGVVFCADGEKRAAVEGAGNLRRGGSQSARSGARRPSSSAGSGSLHLSLTAPSCLWMSPVSRVGGGSGMEVGRSSRQTRRATRCNSFDKSTVGLAGVSRGLQHGSMEGHWSPPITSNLRPQSGALRHLQTSNLNYCGD